MPSRYDFATVEHVLCDVFHVVVDLGVAACIEFAKPANAWVGKVAPARRDLDGLGDELTLAHLDAQWGVVGVGVCHLLVGLSLEEVGFGHRNALRFLLHDGAQGRTELAIDHDGEGLELSVNHCFHIHLEVTIDGFIDAKGVVSEFVGDGIAQEASSLFSVPKGDMDLYAIDRVLLQPYQLGVSEPSIDVLLVFDYLTLAFHGVRVGHLFPVVASPTLHEHEGVGCHAVEAVVFFEIVFRMGDEAAYIAAEQHVGADVAAFAVVERASIHC